MPHTLFLFHPLSSAYIRSSSPLTPKIQNHKPFSAHSSTNIATKENPQFSFRSTSTKIPEFLLSSDPNSLSNAAIKMRTAPWMKAPLILHPNEALDLSKPTNKKSSDGRRANNPDRALTDKVGGVRGKKSMKKIVESIEKLQRKHNSEGAQKKLGKIERGVLLGGFEGEGESTSGLKMPWSKDERIFFGRTKKEKLPTVAELTLDGELLERLRGEARKMRKWVKVKKAGVTQAVVDDIRLIWRRNELALLKFDEPLCRNMDRAREIVEIKTGGLVVWTRKELLVVYRGCSYQSTLKTSVYIRPGFSGGVEKYSSKFSHKNLGNNADFSLVKSDGSTVNEVMGMKVREKASLVSAGISMKETMVSQPLTGSLYEREADRLLDGLGPRFIDWWRPMPLPVDADLLPEVVPGFTPPVRLCPSLARSKLTNDELAYLRKFARPLPTHFVLGRNRKLQGLAAAILKLWEKSYIVKIAVKMGIPNTDNMLMANELKCLTGGILLLRNKFYIILYRGKDFIPCRVAIVIADREIELKKCQLQEEEARLKAHESFYAVNEPSENSSMSGTLSEFNFIQMGSGDVRRTNCEAEVQLEAEKEKLEQELRTQERKLFILKKKIEKSAKVLSKLNSAWRPAEQDLDEEMITDEERECFRKMGLKMESRLMLGRRGIFDGVMEGLHQHWKHREIVKVITMQRKFLQVLYTARSLEAESGGILISVEKLKEGHAIILYRGKNYRRPLKSASNNLLRKRAALCRSLEMQRIGSLKFFAYQRHQTISSLKLKLADLHKSMAFDPTQVSRVHDA